MSFIIFLFLQNYVSEQISCHFILFDAICMLFHHEVRWFIIQRKTIFTYLLTIQIQLIYNYKILIELRGCCILQHDGAEKHKTLCQIIMPVPRWQISTHLRCSFLNIRCMSFNKSSPNEYLTFLRLVLHTWHARISNKRNILILT